MVYELPELTYGYGDLDPLIDEQTMHLHHDKHHATYVTKLNDALSKAGAAQDKPLTELLTDLDQLPEEIRMAVRNNGGGHLNHTLLWQWMTPEKQTSLPSQLEAAITDAFGSVADFKDQFTKAGIAQFGSGWAWLVVDAEEKLKVVSTPNQDNPICDDLRPILGVDVWEHAYYLNYQNRRPDYLAAFWQVINWQFVEECYLDKEGKYLQL
ncbi:superoxide dismutase [Lapidilactobacillus mulanensis]|uniref:Superoxide dismutase n=1 Tax=Lapidilactobacillus mulanensis TaxID=2485999 RepID=A0ABW4DPI0_9LACO|nr:superoxide dismutase [Lapidilactobacillus mulanensis]